MESFGVVGIDRRVIMNVETRMAPRKQQVDALFGDEVEVSEQCEALVTKDEKPIRENADKVRSCHHPTSGQSRETCLSVSRSTLV